MAKISDSPESMLRCGLISVNIVDLVGKHDDMCYQSLQVYKPATLPKSIPMAPKKVNIIRQRSLSSFPFHLFTGIYSLSAYFCFVSCSRLSWF